MRASWTGDVGLGAGVTQRLRAVADGGFSEAQRGADELNDSLDELLRRLDELPPETLRHPSDAGR